MQPQDVVKMCYQAAFGAEHLLADASIAKRYFDAEFDATEPREGELFECLSDEICRVDLGVWKAKGLPPELLFDRFVATARVPRGGKELFLKYLCVRCFRDFFGKKSPKKPYERIYFNRVGRFGSLR